jgi:hypothetical protein
MQPQATPEPEARQPVVTMARIKATLDQVPVNQQNEVYEFLISLLEDAEDRAAIDAAHAEMERTGNRGVLLEDYLRERGLTDVVEAYVQSEHADDE